jgi:hypothetical protein
MSNKALHPTATRVTPPAVASLLAGVAPRAAVGELAATRVTPPAVASLLAGVAPRAAVGELGRWEPEILLP